jgi:hypothetical protein
VVHHLPGSYLLLCSVLSHQIKKTVKRLLSANLTEEDIDDAIENFRQERLLKAEEEAKDVSTQTFMFAILS